MLNFKLFILLLFLSPFCSLAAEIQNSECIESVKKKNYLIAFQQCEIEAEQNNPYAAEMLGFMYLKGIGAPRDWNLANRYLVQSVNLGNINANRYLGVMYWNGFGVKADKDRAHDLFNKCLTFSHDADISCTVQYAKTLSSQTNNFSDREHALSIYEELLQNEAYDYSYDYAKLALSLRKFKTAFRFSELFILWSKRYGDLASLRLKYIDSEKISSEAARFLSDEELTIESNWVKHEIQKINRKANPSYKTNELKNRYKRNDID
jgi:hypothetical protein